MAKIFYQIEFFSEWHCSSGLSTGADIDMLAIKDQSELPYVPGRTIKGLLREAAEMLGELAQGSEREAWRNFIQECFGNQSDKKSNQSDSGKCYFHNAEMSQNLTQRLCPAGKASSQSRALFRKISSTAIDTNGQAREHSLRKAEVTVPVRLLGEIDDCPDSEIARMEQCLQWVKRLGNERNRGLGRCDFKKIPGDVLKREES